MTRCEGCRGFVPAHLDACPNCACSASASGRVKTALGAVCTVALGSLVSMTLMACYGCPDGRCGGGREASAPPSAAGSASAAEIATGAAPPKAAPSSNNNAPH